MTFIFPNMKRLFKVGTDFYKEVNNLYKKNNFFLFFKLACKENPAFLKNKDSSYLEILKKTFKELESRLNKLPSNKNPKNDNNVPPTTTQKPKGNNFSFKMVVFAKVIKL